MTGVRCFVGVPLPAHIANRLAQACAELRAADPGWEPEKWVASDNLHLTLKFLGDVDVTEIDAVSAALGETIGRFAAFELPVGRIHAQPDRRRAKMIWACFLDPEGSCERLASSIDGTAETFGIAPETRAYRPHATLCRARRPKPVSETALAAANSRLESLPGFLSVPSVSLFSSRLTPRGPIYTEIGAWHMRGY